MASSKDSVTVAVRVRPLLARDKAEGARECLRKFVGADGVSMMDVPPQGRCEIYKASSPKAIAS